MQPDSGGDLFWENCAITGVRQRGGRFWGGQVDVELDGTHFEVDGGTAWVFGLKTEGDINGENGFLWAHGGAKVELLGAFNSAEGLKGPAYTIDASDMTVIDLAFNIRKTAEAALATGDNVIVKETRGGVTRLYRNDGSWVKGTGFGLFSGAGGAAALFRTAEQRLEGKSMTTRRTFLTLLGATAATAAVGKDKFAGPLGLEIYSLRRELSKDVPGTLARVRQFGFEEVEVPGLYGLSAAAFRAELDKAGLRCTAMVAQDEVLRGHLESAVSDAKALGAQYVILPWIPHTGNNFTSEICLRAAEDMNRWGAQLRKAGLEMCYHPHGFEFRPSPEGTLFDLLAAKTDPACVNFQADVFWMAWPGQDPAKLLRRYPKRFLLAHLKDLRKGSKTGDLSGQAPEETSVAVGTGMIDFPAVLRGAKDIGVRRYYIEDEAPDAAANIPLSQKYLKAVRF